MRNLLTVIAFLVFTKVVLSGNTSEKLEYVLDVLGDNNFERIDTDFTDPAITVFTPVNGSEIGKVLYGERNIWTKGKNQHFVKLMVFREGHEHKFMHLEIKEGDKDKGLTFVKDGDAWKFTGKYDIQKNKETGEKVSPLAAISSKFPKLAKLLRPKKYKKSYDLSKAMENINYLVEEAELDISGEPEEVSVVKKYISLNTPTIEYTPYIDKKIMRIADRFQTVWKHTDDKKPLKKVKGFNKLGETRLLLVMTEDNYHKGAFYYEFVNDEWRSIPRERFYFKMRMRLFDDVDPEFDMPTKEMLKDLEEIQRKNSGDLGTTESRSPGSERSQGYSGFPDFDHPKSLVSHELPGSPRSLISDAGSFKGPVIEENFSLLSSPVQEIGEGEEGIGERGPVEQEEPHSLKQEKPVPKPRKYIPFKRAEPGVQPGGKGPVSLGYEHMGHGYLGKGAKGVEYQPRSLQHIPRTTDSGYGIDRPGIIDLVGQRSSSSGSTPEEDEYHSQEDEAKKLSSDTGSFSKEYKKVFKDSETSSLSGTSGTSRSSSISDFSEETQQTEGDKTEEHKSVEQELQKPEGEPLDESQLLADEAQGGLDQSGLEQVAHGSHEEPLEESQIRPGVQGELDQPGLEEGAGFPGTSENETPESVSEHQSGLKPHDSQLPSFHLSDLPSTSTDDSSSSLSSRVVSSRPESIFHMTDLD